jgi:hypothetical protein
VPSALCYNPNVRSAIRAVSLPTTGILLVSLALGSACALTRSDVKSLRDRDAARIAFEDAIPTSVTALNEVRPHCGPAGNRLRRAEELRVYQVVGRMTRVRRERDRDVHIVLADLVHPRDRLVIELGDPDTMKARASPYRERLLRARRTFDDLQRELAVVSLRELEGRIVRVTGVGFFDVNHLQRGRSRSCIELHPVLSIEPVVQ